MTGNHSKPLETLAFLRLILSFESYHLNLWWAQTGTIFLQGKIFLHFLMQFTFYFFKSYSDAFEHSEN